MRFEMVNIKEVRPFDKSPRDNEEAVDAVAESISAFGFNCPIVVGPDNRICAGHTRWKAAKKLGIKTVPIIRVDSLTGEKFLAFNIADNQTSTLAQWQDDLLAELLETLSKSQFDMAAFGFSDDELDARLNPGMDIDWDMADTDLSKEITSRWALIPIRVEKTIKSLVSDALTVKAKELGIKERDPAVVAGMVIKKLLGLGV